MKHQVQWLKDAVSKKTTDSFVGGYLFTGDEIRVSNGDLTAGVSFASPVKAIIARAALEGAVKAAPDGSVLEPGNGDKVQVKSRGYRVALNAQPLEDAADLMEPPSDDGWMPLDDHFSAVLTDLAGLILEDAARPWMSALILNGGHAYATTGRILARSTNPVGVTVNALVPKYAVDFIASRTKGLKWWKINSNHIAFRWENGSWLRAQLLQGGDDPAMGKLGSLLTPALEPECLFFVSDEYKTQLQRAFAVLSDLVEITDTKVSGSGDNAEVEIDLPPVPGLVLKKSAWQVAELKRLLPLLVDWNPAAWPKNVPWRGDRLIGVASGVNC